MVDRTSGVPVYRQVADDIRTKIDSGEYPAGDALPSETVLMAEYDISRPTLLGIEVGAEVTVRDRVMKADGKVVQLAVSRFPRDLTRGTRIEETDTGIGGVYARIEEAGHALDRFEETVGTRMPTPAERSQLGLADGVPVLIVTRIAGTAQGPVETNDMVLAGDTYQLVYEWPAD